MEGLATAWQSSGTHVLDKSALYWVPGSLLLCDRTVRIHRDFHLCQWSGSWPRNNCCTPDGIERCAMAGTFKQLILRIIGDRTTLMGTGGIEGHKAIIRQVHKHTRIFGIGEIECFRAVERKV